MSIRSRGWSLSDQTSLRVGQLRNQPHIVALGNDGLGKSPGPLHIAQRFGGRGACGGVRWFRELCRQDRRGGRRAWRGLRNAQIRGLDGRRRDAQHAVVLVEDFAVVNHEDLIPFRDHGLPRAIGLFNVADRLEFFRRGRRSSE
ncbi:MAG TPA: hypothetical protein VFM21_02805 [Terriglobia bacterium]|nr:hypothetical protein [Terriglobia bacterium]